MPNKLLSRRGTDLFGDRTERGERATLAPNPLPSVRRKYHETDQQNDDDQPRGSLLFASVPPLAQGRDARGGLHITGSVICATCELNEIRSTHEGARHRYDATV